MWEDRAVEDAGAKHFVVGLAGEWVDAWNACDGDRIAGTLHEDFRMHRLKGDVVDADGLRDMLARQGYGVAMKLRPRALYGSGERFAVTALVEYRSAEDDELVGSEDGGIAMEVRDELISRAAPQRTSDAALAAAGVTTADLLYEWPVT